MLLNSSDFITTTPLADYSVKYMVNRQGLVANKMFNPHPVAKNTGKWYQYGKDNLRVVDAIAPSGTRAKQVKWNTFTKTFTTVEHALAVTVLGKDSRDFDVAVSDLDQEAAETVADMLLLEAEQAAKDLATTSGNYPSGLVTTLSAGDTWADGAGDPFEDIRATRVAVRAACGQWPQFMTINRTTLDYLKLHPAVIDRIKYVGNLSVTNEMLARLFDLQEIYVADVTKNSAVDGAADSLGDLWGDNAVIFYKDPAARLKSMTYGKLFVAREFYTLIEDTPELGRGKGAHIVESGMEYVFEKAAVESSSSDKFIAGGLIANVY